MFSTLIRNTSKGKLEYDRSPITKDFLENCSPPPKLSTLHDEFANLKIRNVLTSSPKGVVDPRVCRNVKTADKENGRQSEPSDGNVSPMLQPTHPFERSPKPVLRPLESDVG
ncbi:hypothetical protein FSP39_000494 [Pinctada imbricata]|uniref:Uncharacterized protein n=1 Tax=Pinctada imbricata TaxID=66713 RepID=A0AA88XFJ5_PINIB|nr:hypothetical protein FSP39_000494 [Pinctada imbricata]